MKRGPKLTDEQRAQLLKLYLEQGYRAASALAVSLGASERYPAQLARKNGYTNNHQRAGRSYGHKTGARDHRWQWAIQRGAISI
jgi:hypothetical protein